MYFVERRGAVLPFKGNKWVEAEENQAVECCLCSKKIHGVSSCNILLQRGFLVMDGKKGIRSLLHAGDVVFN